LCLGNGLAVFETEQVLEQNLHGERQLRNTLEAIRLGLGQAGVDVVLTTHGQDGATIKAVERSSHGKNPADNRANTRVRTPMHLCTSGCGYDHFRCPHEKIEIFRFGARWNSRRSLAWLRSL